jgi:hypothetical protein
MNINLHIERLILDGLSLEAANRALLQAAVETELVRLLTRDGVGQHLQNGGASPRASASEIRLTAQAGPEQMGKQIAGSIYGSIGKVK